VRKPSKYIVTMASLSRTLAGYATRTTSGFATASSGVSSSAGPETRSGTGENRHLIVYRIDMKTIVISGASSGVGKTALARKLKSLLSGAELIKIGHGRPKADMENHFYPLGTSMETLRDNHPDACWLLIESNSILREAEPDLVIYLDGANPKPSAEYAKAKAHIVSGYRLAAEQIAEIAARLEVSVDAVKDIACISGTCL
jgi:hypothetical protein